MLGSSSVQFYCPRATRLSPYVCGLPSQEYTPNGGFSSTQLSLLRSHSCAHSAVRGGFFAPFLQNCRLTKLVFTACSHTTSPDPIQLSSFYLMGKSTGSQKFCFADVFLSLSDISIKRWLSVVNSNFQNSSFPHKLRQAIGTQRIAAVCRFFCPCFWLKKFVCWPFTDLRFPPPSPGHNPRTGGWRQTAPFHPSRRCRCSGGMSWAAGRRSPDRGCGAPSVPAAG